MEKPLTLCLVHSKLQTMAVSIHRGALQYTDVFLAGLICYLKKQHGKWESIVSNKNNNKI